MKFTVLCVLLAGSIACAKELVLTNDWQVIGDNDTIPKGAHVRMDLTTGEKMAKLVDPDEESSANAVEIDPATGDVVGMTESSAASSSSSRSNAAAVVVQKQEESEDGSNTNEQKKEGEIFEEQANYDFDMMHRTLSKLPPEDQEQMELPDSPGTRQLTAEEREAFEAKMKLIWEKRQADLATFQEDNLVDLPQILKQRIQRIKEYLDDPHSYLTEMLSGEGSASQGDDDGEEFMITDIESVLLDLEYQLADVDMARDFHTLGGWPLLASLLSDDVHNGNHTALTPELLEKRNTVQATAAWAIGTAVKNTGEFFPFATEEIVIEANTKTTALELLLSQYVDSDQAPKKRQKMLYGLGSLLRGNRSAQANFVKLQGPSRLFAGAVVEIKLQKKLLALVGDIVADVVLHDGVEENAAVNDAIVEAFSSEPICTSVSESLTKKQLEETSLRTMEALAPYCGFTAELVEEIERIQEDWGVQGMDGADLDELVGIAKSAIEKIKSRK